MVFKMIIDTTEEVVMGTDVTIVFMKKVEILIVFMICIFAMLLVLVIFSIIM